MGGWTGKALRVNLTDGSIQTEDIPREWLVEYVGGRGLGDRYLYEELDPTVDPLLEFHVDLGCTKQSGDHWSFPSA